VVLFAFDLIGHDGNDLRPAGSAQFEIFYVEYFALTLSLLRKQWRIDG
jgi:hypothetical protein